MSPVVASNEEFKFKLVGLCHDRYIYTGRHLNDPFPRPKSTPGICQIRGSQFEIGVIRTYM